MTESKSVLVWKTLTAISTLLSLVVIITLTIRCFVMKDDLILITMYIVAALVSLGSSIITYFIKDTDEDLAFIPFINIAIALISSICFFLQEVARSGEVWPAFHI